MESDSYLWPLYQFHRTHSDPLDQQRTRVLFYLYENTVEKNTETGAEKRRVDMWPFFTYHRDFNGNNRLQILAPIEPALPDNRGIERNWSPLWSFWVSENNPKTGASSQSFFWNLYRHETTPEPKNARSCSVFSSINPTRKRKSCGCFTSRCSKRIPRPAKSQIYRIMFENIGEIVLLFWRTLLALPLRVAAAAESFRPVF